MDSYWCEPRVRKAIECTLSTKRPPQGTDLQRPSYLYFPDLETCPFFRPSDLEQRGQEFSWLTRFKENFDLVKLELCNLLDKTPEELFEKEAGTIPSSKGKWKVFYFYKSGEKIVENCVLCPRTVSLIESVPQFMKGNSLGFAMLSILNGGGVIQPHYGPTNLRLRVMLPLLVPVTCDMGTLGETKMTSPASITSSLTVGSETQSLEEGKFCIFDDSFLHSASNSSSMPRLVLIFDIWHPNLSPLEVSQINELLTKFF